MIDCAGSTIDSGQKDRVAWIFSYPVYPVFILCILVLITISFGAENRDVHDLDLEYINGGNLLLTWQVSNPDDIFATHIFRDDEQLAVLSGSTVFEYLDMSIPCLEVETEFCYHITTISWDNWQDISETVCFSMAVSDFCFSIPEVSIPINTPGIVEIHLENPEQMYGFQTNLNFDHQSFPVIIDTVLATDRTEDLMISWSQMEDDNATILGFSLLGLPFMGNSGPMVEMIVNRETVGSVDMCFSFVVLSDPWGQPPYVHAECGFINFVCDAAPGDLNQDEVVSILDAVIWVSLFLSGDMYSETSWCASDANLDGDVDVTDIVMIVDMIMGEG